MFVAKNQQNEVVLAFNLPQAIKGKRELVHQKFYCPGCGEKVIYKGGRQKIPHFAHHPQQTCQHFSEGESREHLEGKSFLFELFPPESQLEAYLPQLLQRPDLLWQKLAVEFQCSPLGQKRFLQRTENYLQHGFEPWWILGEHLQPKVQQTWSPLAKGCLKVVDQRLQLWGLDSKRRRLICYQGFTWHYQKGCQFQQQSFPLRQLKIKKQIPQENRWQITEYKLQLQRQLVNKKRLIFQLQETCYLHGGNLLALPDWCYLPGEEQFLLQENLLVLRFLYSKLVPCDFQTWYQQATLFLQWHYPLIEKEAILLAVFKECEKLSQRL